MIHGDGANDRNCLGKTTTGFHEALPQWARIQISSDHDLQRPISMSMSFETCLPLKCSSTCLSKCAAQVSNVAAARDWSANYRTSGPGRNYARYGVHNNAGKSGVIEGEDYAADLWRCLVIQLGGFIESFGTS